MSGDVQPRKRKDKKRRKDEGEQVPTQIHTPVSSNFSNDDINIHIHKESGTGGGICAKLVFFVLLSALAVLIGMIITQYRGTTDVDTVDSDSRFSKIFESWIDSSSDHHDDHNVDEAVDEHSEEHDEEESDLENISEEEHEPSEEEEEEVDEEEAELSEEKYRDDDDDDDSNDNEEEQEDEDENVSLDESEEDIDEDEEEHVQASEERDNESEEKDDDEEEETDEDNHEEDEQELENIEREELDDEGDYGEDDDEDNELDEENRSAETKSTENSGEDEDDTDISSIKKLKTKKKVAPEDEGKELPTAETVQGSSGMAVKLGVGVALLVVAHLVLVRKWRTASDNKPPNEEPKESVTPNLSRRNTIIPPPPYQEVEADIEESEEEYSEDEEDLSEEEHRVEKTAKEKYQELSSTYSRSLTPENEIDYHKTPRSLDEDEYDDEEEEEVSEEAEEEIEEEEEEEGMDSENEDYDEDEDEALLKRLEAKYGKLHEDKNKANKIQQGEEEESESDKESDDGAGYDYSNITSKDDYKIKDKIDEAQKAIQNE